ncbi:hypothetical protein [Pedobacter cryoconitis]|uniref:Uncharacterized protein n=1 Tax=Pedobacter cryoconitis TaxID=188932 RepID=A0A7X0J5P6_9SPHI|nr:hypothetical protein [Pedobacter cryoconitis]MBB6501550.1 hypothetical protein [Pedobacter cryoconitis]
MQVFFTVNTITELLCLMICLFCLFRDKDIYWRSFMIYLFLVCAVEFTGIYLRLLHKSNYELYTYFLVIECTMISCFFYRLYRKYHFKPSRLFSWLGLFMSIYGLELYTNHFSNFAYKTAAIMSVVFVIASLYYYMLILRDEHFRKLETYPPFWIVNGVLFFYFGSTACNVFFDYLMQDKITSLGLSVRYVTFNILNVILYSCWSYAFICRYRQRN